MRQRFDPREHLKAVDVRAEAAAAAAAKLVEDMAAGAADPAKDGFNQGNGTAAGDAADDMAVDAVDEAAEGDDEKAVDAAPKVLFVNYARLPISCQRQGHQTQAERVLMGYGMPQALLDGLCL